MNAVDEDLAGAAEWNFTTLGKLCGGAGGGVQTGPFGSQLHAADYVSKGIPSVMPQNIGENAISEEGIARIAIKDAERLGKYLLKEGDIVYSRRGDVEKRSLIRRKNAGWLCGTGCLRVRLPEASTDDPKFLSYLLGTAEARSWISRHAVGATMPNLNTAILSALPLRVPDPTTQRAIAEVLGALDDKIAANIALAATLSDVVIASFEPIVEDAEEFRPLSELAYIVKGVSYRSADLTPSATALVTLKSFDRNGGYSVRGLKSYSGAYKPSQQIFPGEIAVAQTDLTQNAEVVGRAVRIPGSSSFDLLVASLDLAIVRPRAPIPVEFLLGLLLQPSFREHCRSRTSGTTVLHLGSDAIPSYPAPSVATDAQLRYAEIAKPLLMLRDSVELESEALAKTRDALLPALMSGKLRVKAAEKQVEAVV